MVKTPVHNPGYTNRINKSKILVACALRCCFISVLPTILDMHNAIPADIAKNNGNDICTTNCCGNRRDKPQLDWAKMPIKLKFTAVKGTVKEVNVSGHGTLSITPGILAMI